MTHISRIGAFAGTCRRVACSRSADPLPVPTAPPVTAPVAASPGAAAEQLARLDGRSPVPLLPAMASQQEQNMRDHLAAVQDVVTALSTADFEGVERAAARIGYSQMMRQICTHMGAGGPRFAEQAIEFHHTADRISGAARVASRWPIV